MEKQKIEKEKKIQRDQTDNKRERHKVSDGDLKPIERDIGRNNPTLCCTLSLIILFI